MGNRKSRSRVPEAPTDTAQAATVVSKTLLGAEAEVQEDEAVGTHSEHVYESTT